MSSLRLALKQSLVEAGGGPSKKEKSERKQADLLRKQRKQQQHLQQQQNLQLNDHRPSNKRKPGDPPRKRGRPRKHPLPEQIQQKTQDTPSQRHSSTSSSSDENEFSESSNELTQEKVPLRHRSTTPTTGLFESEDETDSDSDDNNRRNTINITIAANNNNHNEEEVPKEHSAAANKIQSQWKRKKQTASNDSDDSTSKHANTNTGPSLNHEKKKLNKVLTVTPPSIEIVDWMESMSQKKKRRHICAGLRVKVRFATKVKKRDQKVIKKLWYGGLVTQVSIGGSKIRIKYDDGTSEVSKFPDKDVIVDEENNGRHRVPADVFLPPDDEELQEQSEEDEDPEPLEEEQETRVKMSSKQRHNPFTSSKTDSDDSHESLRISPEPNKSRMPTSPIPPQSNVEDLDENVQKLASVEEKNISPNPEPPIVVGKAKRHPEFHSLEQSHSDNADGEKVDHVNATNDYKVRRSLDVLSGRIINDARSFATTDESSDDDDDDDISMEIIEESTLSQVDANAAAHAALREQAARNQTADKSDGEEADNEDEPDYTWKKKRSRDDDDRIEITGHKAAKVDNIDTIPSNLDQYDDDEEAEFEDGELVIESTNIKMVPEQNDRDDEMVQVDDKISMRKSKPRASPVNSKHDTDDEECEEVATATKTLKRKIEGHQSTTSIKISVASRLLGPRSIRQSDILLSSSTDHDDHNISLATPEGILTSSMKSSVADDESVDKDQQSIGISKQGALEKKEKKKLKKNKELAVRSSEDQLSETPLITRMDDLDAMNIPRSGRRAAQAANERIASRQELVIPDEYSKPKKKRLDIKGPGGREPKLKERDGDDSNESEDDNHWVQCDSCSKWRVLPAAVDVAALPKNWYCKLNIYDALRNNCEATEQTAQEVAKAKRKAKRKLARLALLESPSILQPIPEESEVVEANRDKPPKDERRKKKVGRPPKDRKEAIVKKDGRRRDKEERIKRASPVPMQSDASVQPSPTEESGSDSHNKLDARKKLNQGIKRLRDEADDEVKESDSIVTQIKGKRPRGRPAKEHFGNKDGKTGNDKSSDPDNQEWVQCEKCEKWRRLPPHISAADLPDVWYCNMNTWDPYAATCEAQEDKADPGHAPVTGFAGGNKLSYRNLIFGTGKKHNRPISERMRAAESLFSSHPFDHSHEHHPVVLYGNSSVFVARGQPSKSQDEKESVRPSFFDVMKRTSLWTELRGFAQDLAIKNENGQYCMKDATEMTLDNLSPELKSEMQELIYHALGNGVLASHEVLLETQCSPWDDVPSSWSELRALCTVQSVATTLLDLVKLGRVEAIQSTSSQISVLGATPRFRRVVKQLPNPSIYPPEPENRRASRCMKIAKPWKV